MIPLKYCFPSIILLILVFATATPLRADEPKPAPPSTEEADVQKIKEKYWTSGSEGQIGVVQSRIFTKNRKIELDLGLGTLSGDPFLKTTTLGIGGGYFFSEFFSLHLSFLKTFVSASSALKTLQQQTATTVNTNETKFALIPEARGSLLYGKVALSKLSILYFDAYLTGGVGYLSTESGGDPLVTAGIGQQVYINQRFALNVAYKVFWYRETILGKVGGPNGNLGKDLGKRNNLSDMLTVGVTMLLDPTSSNTKKD